MTEPREGYGHIYFVTDGRAIKIGLARNLAKRMAGIQSATYLRLFLIGSVFLPIAHEKLFHSRFHHLKIRGEWFRIGRDLLQFIDTIPGFVEGDDLADLDPRIAKFCDY